MDLRVYAYTVYLAVAAVLSNWHNVLRAINMASSTYSSRVTEACHLTRLAMMPKPKEEEDAEAKQENQPPLPQTLVRIPTQHAPAVIEQANVGAAAAVE